MKFNRNMAEAPKNKPILLDIGQGFPVIGRWQQNNMGWFYAVHYPDLGWFRNEYIQDPIAWAELPKIN